MFRRCGIVAALALWVGGSGCTGTFQRAGGPLDHGSRDWADAPAPSQSRVALPPERAEPKVVSTTPTVLSRYFPGLRRNASEAPVADPAARSSWFSFIRRPKSTQVYMTDSRSGLNQAMADAAALPVSLQVPSATGRATDSAVTPANAERVSQVQDVGAPSLEPDSAKSAARPDASPLLGNLAETPSKPAEPETAPTPVVNRMPDLPPVDPRERPRMGSTTDPSAVFGPQGPSAVGLKADDQANRAIPAASGSTESTEPTLTAFFKKMGSNVRGTSHHHPSAVLASPQSPPSSQVVPQPRPKPSPQVAPTSQAKPSSQAIETSHACVCENCGAKIGKKPCILKRMRKAIFQPQASVVTASSQK